jgi:hypothetical protein
MVGLNNTGAGVDDPTSNSTKTMPRLGPYWQLLYAELDKKFDNSR